MPALSRSFQPPTLRHYDLPRGVYRSEVELNGAPVYCAITTDGFRIEMRRTRLGETPAELRLGLWEVLDEFDAVRVEEPRPHLQLMRGASRRPPASQPPSSRPRVWRPA